MCKSFSCMQCRLLRLLAPLRNERGVWIPVPAGKAYPLGLERRFPPYTLIGWGRAWGGYWGQP